MTPAQKRLLVPLRAPRWPRAPWPLNTAGAWKNVIEFSEKTPEDLDSAP